MRPAEPEPGGVRPVGYIQITDEGTRFVEELDGQEDDCWQPSWDLWQAIVLGGRKSRS